MAITTVTCCRFTKWLSYANRCDLLEKPRRQVNVSYRLCSAHFMEDDFMDPACMRLKRCAIPTAEEHHVRLLFLVNTGTYCSVPPVT